MEVLSSSHYGIILPFYLNNARGLKCLVGGINQLLGMRKRRERPDEMGISI